jgi:hypothetical protein
MGGLAPCDNVVVLLGGGVINVFVQLYSASPQSPHIARDSISKEIIKSEKKWQLLFSLL